MSNHPFGVSPVLPVPDVEAAVDWYAKHLGFNREPLWGDPPPHGSANRGRVGIQFTLAPDYDPRSFAGSIYVFVDDAAGFATELAGNAVEIAEPVEAKDYGMVEFAIHDLNGYRIVFGQYRD